jgi:TATA-binding protein-associated factor
MLETAILPYLIYFIVPILARLSDINEDIRVLSANSFAHLVQLMPLEVRKVLLWILMKKL